jgi:hypothetical protein
LQNLQTAPVCGLHYETAQQEVGIHKCVALSNLATEHETTGGFAWLSCLPAGTQQAVVIYKYIE